MFLFLNVDPKIRAALGVAVLVLGIVLHQVFVAAIGGCLIAMAAYRLVKR
jgi:hypothetical protein